MNIQEYISSGILEAYVLGALSEEESEQVAKMVSSHPELKKELDAIEEAMYNYAVSHSQTPPSGLKAKLMDSIEEAGGKQVHLPKQKRPAVYYLAAASVIVALFSSFFAFYYWSKWSQAKEQILAMEQQNAAMAQNLNMVNNKLQQDVTTKEQYIANLKQDLTLALDTTTHIVKLKGLPLSPTASAVVVWNKSSHDVYIDVKSLPVPPPDMQYQLWALYNGQPIDAGVFEVQDSIVLQRVKNIEGAQAFAVTLERRGGSAVPTMDAMYLMGKL